MVPSVRIALTTCIALMVVGIEARKTQRSGPTPAPPDPYRAAIFSFAAMSVFLILSACAEAPAPRAALPAQRNISAPAPTPCNIPNTGQADTPNVLNSPQPSDTDRLNVECLQGVPPPRTTWSWSAGPRWVEPPGVAAARAHDQRHRKALRQAEEDFQHRIRAGR